MILLTMDRRVFKTMHRVNWEEVRGFTALLFFQDESASPPNVARRLWASISAYDLNQYETAVERSGVLSLLMTLAMIYKEFQFLVFGRGLFDPRSIVQYLGIPAENVKQVLYDNMVITNTSGALLEDILTLDLLNRDCVCDAIMHHFPSHDRESPEAFDRDAVFQLLAFPVGLTRKEMQMPMAELIERKSCATESDQFGTRNRFANFEWKRDFAFIDNRFARTVSYE